MSNTHFFLSRKLEVTATSVISKKVSDTNSYLGEWTATLFFIDRKKCWIILNNATKYVIVLPNIVKADLKNISQIFKNVFFEQMIFEGINGNPEFISLAIGEIKLVETNNDRSAIGTLNNYLYYMTFWKKEYQSFENMPFPLLNKRLNEIPNKINNWRNGIERMQELIDKFEFQSTL